MNIRMKKHLLLFIALASSAFCGCNDEDSAIIGEIRTFEVVSTTNDWPNNTHAAISRTYTVTVGGAGTVWTVELMDGTQGFQVEKVREFASKLEAQGLSVVYYDERMTTMLAEGALLEANMRREDRKKKVDMVAAVVILQSYLDANAPVPDYVDSEEDEEEEYEDGILEMVDEDGNAIRFYLSANIRYAGEDYVLLTCAEAADDIAQDESFIMRSTIDDEGNACYQSLEDEALIAAVYEAYLAQNENA